MQETLDRIIIHIRDIWRYRWYAMIVTWLIIPAGWIAISHYPITYTASAKIYVDTYTVLQPLLKDMLIDTTDSSAYLGLMVRQLVSRPNLKQVAHIIGWDQQAKTSQELETLLVDLERKIRVQGSRAHKKAEQSDFYTISYPSTDPELAKEIVNALIDTFEKNTVEESRHHSNKTDEFLEQQLEEKREKLNIAEANIRQFKRENADALPEQGKGFFQRLQATQATVDEVNLKIKEAEHRKRELQRQLTEVSPTQRATSTDGSPILTPLESRLLALQTRLDELLLKYTEEYPDVIATRHSIAELNKQRDTDKIPVMPNPIHQALNLSLSEVANEIAALQARREEYLHRVRTLRKRIGSLTKVEANLQYLNQDYEAAKVKYDNLIKRQESAALSKNIEQNEKDTRFRIIDPTRILEAWSAIKRQRLLLTNGILLAGIAGGLAVAFLLAQIWPVVYRQRTLNDLTGLPVFGSISRAPTLQFRTRRFLNLTAFALTGMLILGLHGGAVFLQLNHMSIKDSLQMLEGIIG